MMMRCESIILIISKGVRDKPFLDLLCLKMAGIYFDVITILTHVSSYIQLIKLVIRPIWKARTSQKLCRIFFTEITSILQKNVGVGKKSMFQTGPKNVL
jgi:hypothetical protein